MPHGTPMTSGNGTKEAVTSPEHPDSNANYRSEKHIQHTFKKKFVFNYFYSRVHRENSDNYKAANHSYVQRRLLFKHIPLTGP